MMTTAAAFRALPLALETGSSELRRPLGISIVGGLLLSQFLTLSTTPVISRLSATGLVPRIRGRRSHARIAQAELPLRSTSESILNRNRSLPAWMEKLIDSALTMNVSEPFVRRPVGTSLLAAECYCWVRSLYSLSSGRAAAKGRFPDNFGERQEPGVDPATAASSLAAPLSDARTNRRRFSKSRPSVL